MIASNQSCIHENQITRQNPKSRTPVDKRRLIIEQMLLIWAHLKGNAIVWCLRVLTKHTVMYITDYFPKYQVPRVLVLLRLSCILRPEGYKMRHSQLKLDRYSCSVVVSCFPIVLRRDHQRKRNHQPTYGFVFSWMITLCMHRMHIRIFELFVWSTR